jgi:hypothetical protein
MAVLSVDGNMSGVWVCAGVGVKVVPVGYQGLSSKRAMGLHSTVCRCSVVACSRKGLWFCAARRGASQASAVEG